MSYNSACTPYEEDFIEHNWEIMTRRQIAHELNLPIEKVYMIGKRLNLPFYKHRHTYERLANRLQPRQHIFTGPILARPLWFESDDINPSGPGRHWPLRGGTTATRE